jgi:hypothetical protein
MNDRSVNEIKHDINIRMSKLGKLILIRRIACVLSLTSLFISIYNFLLIFWDISNELSTLNNIRLCILFMIFSLIFIGLYAVIINSCTEIKRNIYNDRRILKRLS